MVPDPPTAAAASLPCLRHDSGRLSPPLAGRRGRRRGRLGRRRGRRDGILRDEIGNGLVDPLLFLLFLYAPAVECFLRPPDLIGVRPDPRAVLRGDPVQLLLDPAVLLV